MPKFKVGDQVERIRRIGANVHERGVVIRVIPNKDGQDWFKEYKVNFGDKTIAIFYETQ